MGTHIKQFVLVVVLGVLLGTFFAGTASAAPPQPQVKITTSSSPCTAPCTVTLEAVVEPNGETYSFAWDKESSDQQSVDNRFQYNPMQYFYPDVVAGSPECQNADCSKAQWIYSAPSQTGAYGIKVMVTSQSGYSVNTTGVVVIDPADAPAPIYLASPTTVGLPTVVEALSPKQHMKVDCFQPEFRGSENEVCELYLVKRTGPDASGLYHYQFRFVLANPGLVEVGFSAWNTGNTDRQVFSLTVTGNALEFGDVRSCYWRKVLNEDGKPLTRGRLTEHVYDLYYYSMKPTRAVVKFQVKKDGRWVTKRSKAVKFAPTFGPGIDYSTPWRRKHLRVDFGPPKPGQRVTYQIKNGRELLKQGILSKRACTVP